MTSTHNSIYSENASLRPAFMTTESTQRSPHCWLYASAAALLTRGSCGMLRVTIMLTLLTNFITCSFLILPFWDNYNQFCLCQTGCKSPIACSISHAALVISSHSYSAPWSYIRATALLIAHSRIPSLSTTLPGKLKLWTNPKPDSNSSTESSVTTPSKSY